MNKEEFLKLLPRLIMEDNEVKGAILTTLSGVVATKEDIARLIEHSDRRFEDMQKQMDQRFKDMQKQMDRRFEDMQKQMDRRFNQTNNRIGRVERKVDNLSLGSSEVVEGLSYFAVKREFKKRGYKMNPQIRQHFYDKARRVNPENTDVELDIFHVNPNIIGEATVKITDLDKIIKFVKKIGYIEEMYETSFERFIFTFHVDNAVKSNLEEILKENNIHLVVLQKEE